MHSAAQEVLEEVRETSVSGSHSSGRPQRLLSLDALRGFDMLWIIGAESIVWRLRDLTNWPFFNGWCYQLGHADWNGFRAYDLIFPLFLFISGVTMPFSLSARMARGESKASLYITIIKRGLLLVLLGAVYNGLLRFDWEHTRIPSVLGRIGLAWMFAGLIFVNTKVRGQVIWGAGLLFLYWAAMMLIPVPGIGAGVLTMDGSLVGYIDRLLVPGELFRGVHDPEGILSTIPAITTALMGALAGHFLRSEGMDGKRKSYILFGAGIACLGLGWIWDPLFPVNKNLWTSSFVLVAGGWSLILLSVFYLVIDVWQWKRWTLLFVIIGMNPITVYLAQNGIIDFEATTGYVVNGAMKGLTIPVHDVIFAVCVLSVKLLFLYFLYRKKIFLRV